MIEGGIKELGAALLAGIVIVAVADFVFMQASFGRWFHPAFSTSSSGPAPIDHQSGLPSGSPAGNGGNMPEPVTC